MKSLTLQIILIVASVLFFSFIINLVRMKKLRLKYALTWLVFSVFLLTISIFPQILISISNLLTIKEPVNTIFLIIITFMLTIILYLTLALSKTSEKVKKLTQEIGIIKNKEDKV